jgi:predicted metalloprotease with PDZ domain
VIQTNGLDLKTFQYDYDMSWAAMFLTPDGAILGRYGTRTTNGPGSDSPLTQAGFTSAAKRALALFKNYPGNKDQLAGKTGKDPEYAVPEKTPGLTDKPTPATARQNCIHCHMVKEFALRAKWEAGRLTREDLYVYPMPERIGLTLDLDNGLLVKSVAAGSPTDEAQIAAGDELVSLGGQPLISTADVQWVLNGTPNQAKLPITIRRGGQLVERTLELFGDWKRSDIAWRASSWYALRNGVKFDPLPAADKKSRGIDEDGLALLVKGIFGRNAPKVQQAGLRVNDVIVSVDGQTGAMNESDFIVSLRLDHGPKDALKLIVLRGNERKELTIPLW